MKIPAFQFYPADWRKDPGVQALSYHDRGIWFEILCLMHESDNRGRLHLNGKPMPEEALARLLGLDRQVLNRTLAVLLDYGVASHDDEGALISRRMVKDENLRAVRSEVGKKGGNPVLLKQCVGKKGKADAREAKQKIPSSSEKLIPDRQTQTYPLAELYAAFPDIELSETQINLIKAEVKYADKAAWLATIKVYLANHDATKNRYLPEKIGNLLGVFRKEKANLEKEKQYAGKKSTAEFRQTERRTAADIVLNRDYSDYELPNG